jgi:hypothetical protein
MAADYLAWFEDLFEEAQVPLTPDNEEWLDRAVHRIAGLSHPQEDPNRVLEVIRERFLRLGPPGRQLFAAHLRDEAFARRDSPMRPIQGDAYFDNESGGYS